MANSLKVLDVLKNDEKCVFCRQNFTDELLYGKVYQFGDVITHYFCMLFSSHMEQNGKDEEGILGFLPADVKKEVNRGSKIQCVYCHHEGATISCFLKSCKKKFHYPCGVENGSIHQFFGQFRSFCVSHRRVQNVPQYACKLTEKYICLMCQDEVRPKPSLTTIWAPCCKTAWFHKSCVQRMAISAGYFFKCPNCNNKDDFRKEMSECGIYIPDQDASWELEPNAFHELAERYNSCDAELCSCPKGRSYGPPDGIWEVILCQLCGSQGIHTKCGKGQLDDLEQWTCSLCSSISYKSPSQTPESLEFEDPGPSERIITREVRRRFCARESRPSGRRKRRTTYDKVSDDDSPRRKKNDAIISTNNDSENSSCSCTINGQQTDVVKCNATQSTSQEVFQIGAVNVDDDSDDNESDFEINLRSSIRVERPLRAVNPICDTVIDLLDSDDDSHPSSSGAVTSSCRVNQTVNSNENVSSSLEDDDDVIFVGCDLSNTNNDDMANTALLRFVDNNTVYIVSPADVKRKGGLENLTSSVNQNLATETSHFSRNSLDSSSSSSVVWQSIPLHKSIVHSFPSNQLNSDHEIGSNNCSSMDKFLRKNNSDIPSKMSQNAVHDTKQKWNSDASEIICID